MADTARVEPPDRRTSRRVRGVAAGVLVVLTALAVLVASLAVWADRTLLDRGRFSAAVGRVAQDPQVVEATTGFLTDELVAVLGPAPGTGADATDDGGEGLLLEPGVRARVEEGIRTVLVDPTTRAVVETVVGEAHAVALHLVESDGVVDVLGGGLTVREGVVRVNLVPLVDDVVRRLQAVGVLPAALRVPDLAPGSPAEAQVRQLAAGLGVDLPADFAQVTVYDSQDLAEAEDALARAHDALRLFQRGVVGIVAVAVVLAVLALVVAPRRWRTLAQLGAATAVAMVVAPVGRWQLGDLVVRQVDEGRGRVVVQAAVRSFSAGLRTVTLVLLVVGLVVAVVGVVGGRRDRPSGGRTATA